MPSATGGMREILSRGCGKFCSNPSCRAVYRGRKSRPIVHLKHDGFPSCRHALEAMVSWYEGADGRCRHEIFGKIFKLASGIAVRADLDFAAHHAKQAFKSGVE